MFHLVPLSDRISYADLAAAAAAAARVPEQRLKSIFCMAMMNTLFREQSDYQYVGHLATSALLGRNDDLYAYASYMCTKSAPTAMHMAAVNRRWGPASIHTYETAYNIAFDMDLPFFEHPRRDEAKKDNFARYMRNVRISEAVDLRHLVIGFARKDIRDGGVVVDGSALDF